MRLELREAEGAEELLELAGKIAEEREEEDEDAALVRLLSRHRLQDQWPCSAALLRALVPTLGPRKPRADDRKRLAYPLPLAQRPKPSRTLPAPPVLEGLVPWRLELALGLDALPPALSDLLQLLPPTWEGPPRPEPERLLELLRSTALPPRPEEDEKRPAKRKAEALDGPSGQEAPPQDVFRQRQGAKLARLEEKL